MEKEQMSWGFRAIAANRKEYSSVLLVIHEGQHTPYIYNKKRDKVWTVLQGVVVYIKEGKETTLQEGESVHIKARVMHSAVAVQGDATIIETGTQLLDDEVIVKV